MIFRSIILSLAVIFFTLAATAAEKMTLDEAISKQLVQANVTGNGGHTGKALKIELVSNHKKDLDLTLPAGMHFKSDDEGIQDLILTRAHQTILASNGRKTLVLYAMCTQRHNVGPGEGDLYAYNGMAEGNLLKVAEYISQKNYQNDAGQASIWAITDGGGLYEIYDDSEAVVKDMQTFMAELTGQTVPWYSLQQENFVPGPDVNPEPSIIHAKYEYTFTENASINLGVYDSEGNEVYLITENQPVRPGTFRMNFKLTVQNMPRGTYYVRVTNGDQLLDERIVEI